MSETGGQDEGSSLPPLPDSDSLEPEPPGVAQPAGQALPSANGSQQVSSQVQSQEGPLGQPGDDFAGLDADGLWSESLWGRCPGQGFTPLAIDLCMSGGHHGVARFASARLYNQFLWQSTSTLLER